MIVGFEWLIDAKKCNQDALRDVNTLRDIFARIISDLQLKTIGDGIWHKFDGEGGVTGMVMLTESHLTCHTYPEHGTATFNLYCCRERPEWDWTNNLKEMLGAELVVVEQFERGVDQSRHALIKEDINNLRQRIDKSQRELDETRSEFEDVRWEYLELKTEVLSIRKETGGGDH